MPQTTTLLQLRTQARERADMEDTTFVSDSELTSVINFQLGRLYDILVNSYEDYFVSVDTSTSLSSGTETYALPSDFYKMLSVFYKDSASATQRWLIPRFERQSLGRINDEQYYPLGTRGHFTYRLEGANIRVAPATTGGGVIEMHYVPEVTKLSADGDTLTFNVPTQGWDQYIVAGAAARMLMKEESDASALLAEQAEIADHIIHSAKDRDAGMPHQIWREVDRFGPTSRRWR